MDVVVPHVGIVQPAATVGGGADDRQGGGLVEAWRERRGTRGARRRLWGPPGVKLSVLTPLHEKMDGMVYRAKKLKWMAHRCGRTF
jgi:hypothetical protein